MDIFIIGIIVLKTGSHIGSTKTLAERVCI